MGFRRDGTAFSGSHSTYEVRASPAGLTINPRRRKRTGAELTLAVATIERGGVAVGAAAADPSLDDDAHVVIERGQVIEDLRSINEGVEQAWRFVERPRGPGDLIVRIQVSGLRHVGGSQGGLHFADERDKLGLRYGNGEWVDARGTRTAVPARWNGREIVLRVPAEVVERSLYPATLDPLISPEFGMDNPLWTTAPEWQGIPAIASNGADYLVVWQAAGPGLRATRVTSAGVPLDPGGIRILGYSTRRHEFAALSSDGTNYFIVWQQEYSSGSGDWDIRGARMSAAGTVLDPGGFTIEGLGSGRYEYPAVAFDGTNYLVVWAKGGSLGATRVSTAGTLLITGPLPYSTGIQSFPSVAYNGTNFLVAWEEHPAAGGAEIYGIRISPAGMGLDTTPILISTAANDQNTPSVASDGTGALVVWEDHRSGTSWDIYGARVSSAGTVLDPGGIAISTAIGDQQSPVVAYDGGNYLVTWDDYRAGATADIYGARVSAAGTVLDPAGIGISTAAKDQWVPAVASNGKSSLVVWEHNLGGATLDGDIYGARVTPAGTVLDPAGLAISVVTNNQGGRAVAYDGTNYLVVWGDDRGVGVTFDVYAARVSPTVGVLDSSPIAISTATGNQYSPAVAFDGTNYFVVWVDDRAGSTHDIYGARVSKAGTVLDPGGIAISTAAKDQEYPAVKYDGTNYLVVWSDYRSSDYDIYAARVSKAGTVLDPGGIAISTGAGWQDSPTLAYDGTNYLVVWRDFSLVGSMTGYHVYGARVSTAGTVLAPGKIAVSSDHGGVPTVAYDGTNHLVAWYDDRMGSDWNVYAARVTTAGDVLDPSGIAISTAPMRQQDPNLVYDGTNYLVVWTDERSGGSSLDFTGDLYGGRVTSSGSLLDGMGFPIAASSLKESAGAMAAGPPGQVLVTYHVSPILGSTRVRARFIGLQANGSSCLATGDCASGYCVDSVCCDAACGGGDTSDCQACSIAAGAASNGQCGMAMVCRPAADPCDLPEMCDTTSLKCPADLRKTTGTACEDGNPCTGPDTCMSGVCAPGPTSCADSGSGSDAVSDRPPDSPPDALIADGAPETPADASSPPDKDAGPGTDGPTARDADRGDGPGDGVPSGQAGGCCALAGSAPPSGRGSSTLAALALCGACLLLRRRR